MLALAPGDLHRNRVLSALVGRHAGVVALDAPARPLRVHDGQRGVALAVEVLVHARGGAHLAAVAVPVDGHARGGGDLGVEEQVGLRPQLLVPQLGEEARREVLLRTLVRHQKEAAGHLQRKGNTILLNSNKIEGSNFFNLSSRV